MAQNWTIAVGRLAPPPLAFVPLSHLILLPCACYIGYSYRILHGKCGRTVFSYELLTYFKKSKEWDFWYKNSNLGNTVQSIFHVILCSSLILQAFYFKSFWTAKISKKKKKKWQLHTAKLTWQRKRRIFIGGTFGKNYNEGKDIKVTQELQEFQIHKQLTEEKINVSNTGKWGGGGGTPNNSWWGCAAWFSKYWPYYRPKHVIFHARFQT